MANMTSYLEAQCRDHVLRASTFAKPGTIAIVLTKNVPSATYTGQTTDELANAGGYARQVYASTDANWSVVPGASGQTYNNNTITFPVATADQGWVSGVLIVDNATYGTGNALMFGTLTNPREIKNTDQYTIAPSGFNVQWS